MDRHQYQNLLIDFENYVLDNLIEAVKSKWSWGRAERFLDSVGKRLTRFDTLVADFESTYSALRLPRIQALNAVYINAFQFMQRITARPLNLPQILSDRVATSSLIRDIDNVLTVTYKNGAKHLATDYLDAVISYEVAKAENLENIERLKTEGVVYAQVSTNVTERTCFICWHWLGVIGTIGHSIPGYPRLDFLFPIHIRCIHYIIPYSKGNYSQPYESWMASADRKIYYQKALEEGYEPVQYNKPQRQRYRGIYERIASK